MSKQTTITFSLDEDLGARFNNYCKSYFINKSAFLADVLRKIMEKKEGEKEMVSKT